MQITTAGKVCNQAHAVRSRSAVQFETCNSGAVSVIRKWSSCTRIIHQGAIKMLQPSTKTRARRRCRFSENWWPAIYYILPVNFSQSAFAIHVCMCTITRRVTPMFFCCSLKRDYIVSYKSGRLVTTQRLNLTMRAVKVAHLSLSLEKKWLGNIYIAANVEFH